MASNDTEKFDYFSSNWIKRSRSNKNEYNSVRLFYLLWASHCRRRTVAGCKQGYTGRPCDLCIPSRGSKIVGRSSKRQKKNKPLWWLPAMAKKKRQWLRQHLWFGVIIMMINNLCNHFWSLTVPVCRPEEYLSSHSGTTGYTWLCNYSAPSIKTHYIL